MDKVTVITITRHRPQQIFRAISSVQEQKYQRSKLLHKIVVDDCLETWNQLCIQILPDNLELNFMNRSPKDTSGPGRLAKLRNWAVRQSTSDMVCFLDDDNEYLPDHISTLVNCVQKTGCRAVHSYMFIMSPDGQPYLEERLPWTRDRCEGRREYKKLQERGVFTPGQNIVCDRVDPLGTSDPIRTVDTGEWLFDRSLLLEYPFPEEYTADDWETMTTEDDKLLELLVDNNVKIACTYKPTFKYYLGGYSNSFSIDENS